jgi:glycosyltransferase involved in cell wall biosynthesis
MCFGKPIITTTPNLELVEDAAITVPARNVEKLKEALFIMASSEVRAGYAQKAKERSNLFSYNNMINQTFQIYKETLSIVSNNA